MAASPNRQHLSRSRSTTDRPAPVRLPSERSPCGAHPATALPGLRAPSEATLRLTPSAEAALPWEAAPGSDPSLHSPGADRPGAKQNHPQALAEYKARAEAWARLPLTFFGAACHDRHSEPHTHQV